MTAEELMALDEIFDRFSGRYSINVAHGSHVYQGSEKMMDRTGFRLAVMELQSKGKTGESK